ncbi:MAG: hypothetical protein OEM97_04960, partial [Acidimicrobiia bacterium]|nr:hypothetical protein [Acidimicrobiia bacterium]
ARRGGRSVLVGLRVGSELTRRGGIAIATYFIVRSDDVDEVASGGRIRPADGPTVHDRGLTACGPSAGTRLHGPAGSTA